MTRWLPLLIVLSLARGEDAPARPLPLTDTLLALALAHTGDGRADAWSRAELDRIAAQVRAARARTPELSQSAALNQTVFGALGFTREVDDTSLRFVLLPSVLTSRRGSCVGLGSLYLALGERLGWKVSGVMVPGHFFVRLEDQGTTHNLELLRRGEQMPDSWYRGRFPIPGGAASAYARPLAAAEVAGVVEYDTGNELRRSGRLHDAERAYDSARRHFPSFAEAHASFGAVAQLLGALDSARSAYATARRANPNLPGLDRNLALLDAEIGRR